MKKKSEEDLEEGEKANIFKISFENRQISDIQKFEITPKGESACPENKLRRKNQWAVIKKKRWYLASAKLSSIPSLMGDRFKSGG